MSLPQSRLPLFFLRCAVAHVQPRVTILRNGPSHHCCSQAASQSLASTRPLHCWPHLPRILVEPWPYVSLCLRTYSKKGKDKGGKAHKKVILTQEQLDGLVNLEEVKQEFERSLDDLKDKFIHQLVVRTSQGVFDNLIIKTPDGNFPLIQLGQVFQKSGNLLEIHLATSPQYIPHVKKALEDSGMNVNPQQDGTSLFIPLPKVTKEHRENLAKNAKALSEKAKKHIRDAYSKYSRKIKNSKEEHGMDLVLAADEMVQDLMHEIIQKVDDMTTAKQHELLGGK